MARGAAVVIGGAVAKGAFAAGALEELAAWLDAAGVPVRAVVGTSSGALNALMLAAGVRAGAPLAAAHALVGLWERDASLLRVFAPDPGAWWHRRGISGLDRVLALVAEHCPRRAPGAPEVPVTLSVVVAPLAGDRGGHTSFERVERFEGADLDADAGRARAFSAAVASAAFPLAFEPVALPGAGPCVDGGLVNDTPVGEALDRDPAVDAVYVISADPADLALPEHEAAALGGAGLALRLFEMVVDERLTRDLAEARAVNGWLDALDALVAAGHLGAAARAAVVQARFPDRDPAAVRQVDLVEIRPPRALPGNPFTGFVSRRLRRDYVALGRAAARSVLS